MDNSKLKASWENARKAFWRLVCAQLTLWLSRTVPRSDFRTVMAIMDLNEALRQDAGHSDKPEEIMEGNMK